jgi:hypothetical protein
MTYTGKMWVLSHERKWFGKRGPQGFDEERTIPAVFWSKEAGRAYVEREYGLGAEWWGEGDPDGGLDFIVVIAADRSEELHLTLELVAIGSQT